LWLSKGNILYKHLKRYQEAIDCYDKVLQLDPDDKDSKKNRESALQETFEDTNISKVNTADSKTIKEVFEKSWHFENPPLFIAVDSKDYVYVTIDNLKYKYYRKFFREKQEAIYLDGLIKI
jgi:tetratricopeptide (TPR) repeat protein